MADFTTTDPDGNELTLTDECWDNHILTRRPEMALFRRDVELALQRPTETEPSRQDSGCRLYIRPLTDDPGRQVVVVADLDEGVVKTAYLERARKGARRHGHN